MDQNRILIVEDEFIVARNPQRRLTNLGFSVPAVASTAEQAILEAERTHPDLVLMDIRLEGEEDGIAAAREIHERLGIPVVYLTAYADADTVRRAKVAEPLGFLPKPFGLRELQTTIEVALYKHGVDRRRRGSERRLSTALHGVSDGVIATDGRGRVTFMNPAAEALTGVCRACAEGRPVAEVLSATGLAPQGGDGDWARAALDDGRLADLNGDLTVRSAGGEETPAACSATPLIDERDRVEGVVLVLHDLRERLRAEEALRDDACRCRELDAGFHDAPGCVKTLHGLLPICSACRRVRGAEGEWHELDHYLSAYSEADVHHVPCPQCARRLYPRLDGGRHAQRRGCARRRVGANASLGGRRAPSSELPGYSRRCPLRGQPSMGAIGVAAVLPGHGAAHPWRGRGQQRRPVGFQGSQRSAFGIATPRAIWLAILIDLLYNGTGSAPWRCPARVFSFAPRSSHPIATRPALYRPWSVRRDARMPGAHHGSDSHR